MFSNPAHLDWNSDGALWPNRQASRFVSAGNQRFHVQIMGAAENPAILLVHGTGASAHSFRDVLPLLAKRHHVIVPDLPGHGFTQNEGSDLSLPGMARALGALTKVLKVTPQTVVGHSAGVAIAMQMALEGSVLPNRIIGFNSALKPIEGDHFFSPLAKALFLNPFVPRAFSSFARYSDATGRLLEKTGSVIDAAGREFYGKLLTSPAHVAGALGMMANWNLGPLRARMNSLPCPVTLVAAEDDRMVPASVSREAAQRIVDCELIIVAKGGHLLHEAKPEFAAQIIEQRCSVEAGALSDGQR